MAQVLKHVKKKRFCLIILIHHFKDRQKIFLVISNCQISRKGKSLSGSFVHSQVFGVLVLWEGVRTVGVSLSPAPFNDEESFGDGRASALVTSLLVTDPVNPFLSFPVNAITKSVRVNE